jgi:uncharacterized protein with HEPN domain
MAAKTPRAPLTDIRDAIRRIDRYTKGMSRIEFERDELVCDAVERCIEIISEASRRIPTPLKSEHPDIPWSKIAGVGNIFRHEYDEIHPALVWEMVKTHLPQLKRTIATMMRRMPRKPAS